MFIWNGVLFVFESANLYRIALSDLSASKASTRI